MTSAAKTSSRKHCSAPLCWTTQKIDLIDFQQYQIWAFLNRLLPVLNILSFLFICCELWHMILTSVIAINTQDLKKIHFGERNNQGFIIDIQSRLQKGSWHQGSNFTCYFFCFCKGQTKHNLLILHPLGIWFCLYVEEYIGHGAMQKNKESEHI